MCVCMRVRVCVRVCVCVCVAKYCSCNLPGNNTLFDGHHSAKIMIAGTLS